MKEKVLKIGNWLMADDTIGIAGALIGVVAWIFFWKYLLVLAGGAFLILGIMKVTGCE